MKKNKVYYICNACGSKCVKWSGQCLECLAWNTIQEEIASSSFQDIPSGLSLKLENFSNHNIASNPRIKVPIKEIDYILGGGLVQGAVILLGGDPGIGKSTLLLQLTLALAAQEVSCLYITGEESSAQVKLRAQRFNSPIPDTASIVAATSVEDIIATLEQHPHFQVVIIDSIQTLHSNEVSSAPGTVTQIRTTAQYLINYAKAKNVSIFFVGHVTKDGQIAGPRLLEHMVDTVLYFEGDHNYHFRLLRSVKNRFGPTGEVGVFEMTAEGLREITNPSSLFLNHKNIATSGTSIFVGIEGTRPILLEIQTLLTPCAMLIPRRTVVGWDPNRLAMILAILAVRYGLNLAAYEVYLTVVGGFKITEPAADLAIAAALISAALNKPIKSGTVFFGELGLSGEVRKVLNASSRINEADKIGFSTIIGPELGIERIIGLSHISQLKKLLT